MYIVYTIFFHTIICSTIIFLRSFVLRSLSIIVAELGGDCETQAASHNCYICLIICISGEGGGLLVPIYGESKGGGRESNGMGVQGGESSRFYSTGSRWAVNGKSYTSNIVC